MKSQMVRKRRTGTPQPHHSLFPVVVEICIDNNQGSGQCAIVPRTDNPDPKDPSDFTTLSVSENNGRPKCMLWFSRDASFIVTIRGANNQGPFPTCNTLLIPKGLAVFTEDATNTGTFEYALDCIEYKCSGISIVTTPTIRVQQ